MSSIVLEGSRKSATSTTGHMGAIRKKGQRYNTKLEQYPAQVKHGDSMGTDSIDERQTTIDEGRTRHTNRASHASQQSLNTVVKGKLFRKRDASIHTSMGDAAFRTVDAVMTS